MHPERIIIEPSGVGKLSDVIRAVQKVESDELVLNSFTTVVDVNKCKIYVNNFGEFFNDQIQHANSIILSRTQNADEKKVEEVVEMLKQANPNATIVTTPWDQLTGDDILDTLEHKNTLEAELKKLAEETAEEEHHHHHHHHHHEEEEHEHHHDHDDEDEEEHEHHHHHDEDEDEEHEHHHHHHDEDEEEHEHHEHHHHHHHHDDDEDDDHDADEIFDSYGYETSRKYDAAEIEDILKQLDDRDKYGFILRAKGIVAGKDGNWIHFDYVPEEISVRTGNAISRGRFCVIGAEMNFEALEELFDNKG